jgi:hypothetical protein
MSLRYLIEMRGLIQQGIDHSCLAREDKNDLDEDKLRYGWVHSNSVLIIIENQVAFRN